ncbi:hypothetical protein OE88DRAFT_1735545 [Heliocybe sulcata]|uniref:Uncharacterized protein n=1 Tax=Heliocybe sulcata TaxID=5364 RepID=A0A5C3MZ74_9AGAM|nr:hypothetical protein OE88DRAFT_1735545 [Heliocybe sulcata]
MDITLEASVGSMDYAAATASPLYSVIASTSLGDPIEQPTEGAPVPDFLNIKVRDRYAAPYSAIVVFEFDLRRCATFGSQAAARWLNGGRMVSSEGRISQRGYQTGTQHIFKLLGWRYTSALSETSNEDDSPAAVHSARRTPNWIDRAVSGEHYAHIEDERLQFNLAREAADA